MTQPSGAAVKDLVEIRPDGTLHLNQHPGQSRAWISPARFVFVIAGTQGGKTSWSPWWLYREIYGGELRPGVAWPGRGSGDYLAVTSNFDLFKLKMLPAMREVFEGYLGAGRYWAGSRILELRDPETGAFWAQHADDRMWGRIILRSASAEGGLEASSAKAAWLDECGQDAFRISSWQAVLRRLSLAGGRVLGTTTPYNLGWLKTEVYDRFRAGDPLFDVVQFPSVINPAFPLGEFERARATMAAWKFEMFYLGGFSRPAGLIYADFDTRRHVVDPFPIPAAWDRWVGIDFGAVHNATVWLAQDPATKVYYVYRETLTGDMTTAEHCRRVKSYLEHDVPYPEPVHPGGEQPEPGRVLFYGGAAGEKQNRYDWNHEGVRVRRPPIGDVEAGIDRVIQLIKRDQLRVFRPLKGLIEEFSVYSREVNEAGEPTERIKNKADFHRLDALRYAATAIIPKREVGITWLS